MAELSDLVVIESHVRRNRQRRSGWWFVFGGPLAGATLGVVARCWMRLISDDPEFSWDGTVFIVLAFTIAGTGHGAAWAARRAGVRRRWSTTARVAAGVATLPIFAGAGLMMLPTVVGASVAAARTDWPRTARLVAGCVAVPVPILIGADLVRGGLTPGVIVGMVLLVATYAVVVRSSFAIAAPIDDGWRLPRIVRVIALAAVVMVLVLIVLSVAGLG